MNPSSRSTHRARDLLGLAYNVPGMDDSWNPAQNAEKDVDEEIGAAATAHSDWEERQPYGEEVEEDCSLCRF